MSSPAAGGTIASTVTATAALGFVPVAVHFKLFDILAGINQAATGEEVLAALQKRLNDNAATRPSPGLLLIQDTLYAMAGLGFVDLAGDNLYSPNAVTRHFAAVPSAQHGATHFTTEVLFASAFLMRKLEAENFQYPFKECETPVQYAYKLIGNDALAKEHTYSIMAAEGRMDSFNHFMVGKFVKAHTTPERLQSLGYDLATVISQANPSTSITMVDIGGGRGEMLLEIKDAFPQLEYVVEEFNDDIDSIPGISLVTWNYKEENSPQPVHGALVYHLAHIIHNLPDLDAARLLQKIAAAMAPYSRLLIHEYPKNLTYAKLHTAMITLFGGRERSSTEWKAMAALVGLKVTFEAYPAFGEGVVEMMKV